MIRMYYGVVIDGKWYNYFTLKKMQGGTLAILDGADKSSPSRMFNIAKGCLDKLCTESGDEIEVKDKDIYKIKIKDAQRITREYIKTLPQNNGKHIFTENFRCKRCSGMGHEKFTEVCECWEENDSIYESFCESKDDLRYEAILPNPIEIDRQTNIEGGSFSKIYREQIDLGKAIDIVNDNWAASSEKNLICKTWDSEIVEIEGMSPRTWNAHVKLKGQSFSAKYLTDEENQQAMNDHTEHFGMDFSNRVVRCKHCNMDIGGYADYTNFFLNLFNSKNKGHI